MERLTVSIAKVVVRKETSGIRLWPLKSLGTVYTIEATESVGWQESEMIQLLEIVTHGPHSWLCEYIFDGRGCHFRFVHNDDSWRWVKIPN